MFRFFRFSQHAWNLDLTVGEHSLATLFRPCWSAYQHLMAATLQHTSVVPAFTVTRRRFADKSRSGRFTVRNETFWSLRRGGQEITLIENQNDKKRLCTRGLERSLLAEVISLTSLRVDLGNLGEPQVLQQSAPELHDLITTLRVH